MSTHDRLPIGMHTFECRDAAALAGFWSRFLDRPVDGDATAAYATIGFADEGPTWMFVQVDEPQRGRNVILDFAGEQRWREEAERAVGFGAEQVDVQETSEASWVELRDPDGNTFRIFAPRR